MRTAVLFAVSALAARAQASDTAVYFAHVRTQDPKAPIAEALAVRDGKVLAVGTRAQVLAAAGSGAPVTELGAATIVPGLEDAHGHLLLLGNSLVSVSLRGAATQAEAVARVKNAPSTSYQGDWLVGTGWDQNGWPETHGEFPTRAPLDAIFPVTPVALLRVDAHAMWVNGEALRRLGITRATPQPEGGRIVLGPDGEPTGVLVDKARDLVWAKMPPLTTAQREARLRAAIERCAAAGLTAVHDAGMDLDSFRVLQAWDKAGKLPIRVYAMAMGWGKDVDAYLQQGPFHGDRLEMRAVKFVLDGALGSRGAALLAPYSDEPSQRGILRLTEAEFERGVRRFMAKGFQVAVHAIGDRTNRMVLDVFERAQREFPKPGRNRIEHAQILTAEDLPRFARLGVIASMQPTHCTSDMAWAERRLGKDRLAHAYAWRSILDSGAHLAFGSDFPIEAPDALPGLYAARTRQNAQGEPKGGWFPNERVTGEEALAAFTTGAAYASFAEDRRGVLVPGMDADFTALSVDPVAAPAEQLVGAKVVQTVVAGRAAYVWTP